MSVIVSRALPDVRDGLKPVHRRVLYAMHEAGLQPNRPTRKSARVVGDVMGNYHPHGDSAIYDALVRLAQPFSMRYPLIDGQGYFGSVDGDPAGAMRYCVAGDTRVATPNGTFRMDDIVPDAAPESDSAIDLEVLDRAGKPVKAQMLFHSGEHATLKLRTREGFELTGTVNHPVLCLVDMVGIPLLMWKLLDEVSEGDRVVISRKRREDGRRISDPDRRLAVLLGASAEKDIPELVWRAPLAFKRAFLQSLFEDDGSSSLLPRNSIQISYSTYSDSLARGVQQLLLEFGVVARLCRYAKGEIKVVIGNRRDARLFAAHVGFFGAKQTKLARELSSLPQTPSTRSRDYVPYLADYVRSESDA